MTLCLNPLFQENKVQLKQTNADNEDFITLLFWGTSCHFFEPDHTVSEVCICTVSHFINLNTLTCTFMVISIKMLCTYKANLSMK